MARKGGPTKRQGARQELARRKALDYVKRLGLRKAAKRLEVSVKDFERWLDKGFPRHKIEEAIGLGQPGGAFTHIRGAKLKKLVDKTSVAAVARLTGVPATEIKERLAKWPGSAIKFKRSKLTDALKKLGPEKLADKLGTERRHVTKAEKIPRTLVTERLDKFTEKFGAEKVTNLLGITKSQLTKWLKTSIPPKWESDVSQIIGHKSDRGRDTADLDKKRGNIKRAVETARNRAKAWNAKAPRKYRILLADAERWARLGTFNDRFADLKAAVKNAKKPQKPGKPKPPPKKKPAPAPYPPSAAPTTPPTPPPPPPPGVPGEKPPRPPKPPKKTPPPPPSIPEAVKSDFLQGRIEAFSSGRYPRPEATWNRLNRWRLTNRNGVRIYKRVEKFVHEIDLDRLAMEIIKTAKKLWPLVNSSPQAFLTIHFVFSMKGVGNPFYEEHYSHTNDVNFISRNLVAHEEHEIERGVSDLMQEIYYVDSTVTMLFLEYYEVIKSRPN